jgi:hypothetical protein
MNNEPEGRRIVKNTGGRNRTKMFLFCRVCVFVFTALIFLPADISAWQWPFENFETEASFGENIDARFLGGVVLSSSEAGIKPIEDGEVIFRSPARRRPTDLYGPSGGFVALSHANEYRSVYGNLEPGSITSQLFVTVHDAIAEASTGVLALGRGNRESPAQVFLQILDTEQDVALNPRLVLPLIPDRTRPVVGSVYLIAPERDRTMYRDPALVEEYLKDARMEAGRRFAAGDWVVLVETYDPGPDGRRTGVHRVEASLDGVNQLDIVFDTLTSAAPLGMISGDMSFEQLYRDRFVIRVGRVEIPEGVSRITVGVEDYAGNRTERTVSIQAVRNSE